MRWTNVPTDHPHARGENAHDRQAHNSGDGPSPRTWGEQAGRHRAVARRRTIPTHVGRTLSLHNMTRTLTDHPHARGENSYVQSMWPAAIGPSPRTWGEHPHPAASSQIQRTIPTHVGRTRMLGGFCPLITDHPHARGENPFASVSARLISDHPHARGENSRSDTPGLTRFGPSPRTWGERVRGEPSRLRAWTIPTHVGRTF